MKLLVKYIVLNYNKVQHYNYIRVDIELFEILTVCKY